MAAPTTSHEVTHFESYLQTAGMDDNDEREALTDALAHESIGITSAETTAAWAMGALTCQGAEFVAAMKQLVTDCLAVETNLDGHPQNALAIGKLTSAVRTALKAEALIKESHLATLGLSPRTPAGVSQLVISNEGGEALPTSAEIEALMSMNKALAGYSVIDAFKATKKVVSFFVRGIKSNPPNLQYYNLDYVVPEFEANQKNIKPLGNAFTEMAREHSVYDPIDPVSRADARRWHSCMPSQSSCMRCASHARMRSRRPSARVAATRAL